MRHAHVYMCSYFNIRSQVVLSCHGFVFVRNMIVRKHLLSPTRRVGGRQEGERWRSGSAECMQGRLACPAHYTLTLIHSLFFLRYRTERQTEPPMAAEPTSLSTTDQDNAEISPHLPPELLFGLPLLVWQGQWLSTGHGPGAGGDGEGAACLEYEKCSSM